MIGPVGAILVALALGVADGANAAVRPDVVTMEVDGKDRRFVVAGPPRGVRPRGLIVGLHGGGTSQTGRGFGRDIDLFDRATAQGWVVVAPDALEGRFHAGDCCGRRPERTDDVRFITSAVRYTRHRYRVRRGPVVATGFSTGGFMAYRLACQTRLVSAIAVIAGLDVTGRPCRPLRPISVLHIAALDDRTVPYRGRHISGEPRRGVLALTRSWTRRGRCARLVTSDKGEVRTRRATQCRRGVRVATITTRTGGHAWSGAHGEYGPGSTDLDATGTLLDFFER